MSQMQKLEKNLEEFTLLSHIVSYLLHAFHLHLSYMNSF